MLNDPYKSARLITTSSISPREHACNLFDHMKAMNVSPDCFTLTLFMSMQNNREEITETWNDIMEVSDFRLEPPAFHSLITAYGKVGDASSACYVLNKMIEVGRLSRTSNSWCVLLSALSKASSLSCRDIINCNSCSGTGLKIDMANLNDKPFHGKDLVDIVNGCTYPQAAKIILDLMTSSPSRGYDEIVPRPNSQAYCLVASSLSHTDGVGPDFAISMFNNATANGRRVDGRYLNAIIRCYGENITAAVDAWKNVFRPTVLNTFTEDIDRSSSNFPKSRVYKNLVASYHGLIYVAGRAYRPDVALRLVYAMTKEGVEPTEAALNTYNSGARERREDAEKVKLHGQYENLLAIECTKYDSKDERRQTDQRIRIIL
jgi:pentatricopeptide repeat domain (PPR motif)